MKDSETILVIDANKTYVTGFLFSVDDDEINLVDYRRILHTVDVEQLVEVIQLHFKGRFDRFEVITDRTNWFSNALKGLYPEGLTMGIVIDGDQSMAGASSYGRVYDVKKYDVGTIQALDATLGSDAIGFLMNWLEVVSSGRDFHHLINYLGNRQLYPGLTTDSPEFSDVMLGIFQIILKEIHPGHSFFKEESVSFTKGSHRIVISGDFAREVTDYGGVLLSIISGLALEGVWEIVLDRNSILSALGFTSISRRLILEDVGIQSLGSVIIPSHGYKWGTNIGEMQIDLGLSEDQVLDLRSGEIVRLPLERNVKGSIELKVKPSVEVIGYQGLEKISGGSVGLVVDLRGQPLPSMNDVKRYQKQYRHWKEALR